MNGVSWVVEMRQETVIARDARLLPKLRQQIASCGCGDYNGAAKDDYGCWCRLCETCRAAIRLMAASARDAG